MQEQEYLQAGISAIRSGDQKKAASILAQLIKEYPKSERGWYLLGMCVPTTEQRQYCYRQVLSINPNNPDAKKQLSLLSAPVPAPTPRAFTPLPPSSEPVSTPIPQSLPISEPVFRSAAPFVAHENDERAEAEEQKKLEKQNLAAKKKRDRQILIASIVTGIAILICTSIAAVAMFSGRFTPIPISSPIPTQQNQPSPTPTVEAPTAINTLVPPTQLPTQLPTPLPTVVYTPLFEEAPCQFKTPVQTKVTCGYAIVPENRTSNSTDTIKLAVAVFHSTSNNPAPDPVLFLQGGPGGEAVELSANAYEVLVEPFLSERDYITFDQRGTGRSEPALKCDELDKAHRQDIQGMMPAESKEYIYQNALLSCYGLLQAGGVDFSAYSTVESAADLRDIVKLLGYEKVNLYGASYGTRLALVTMRNHPEIIRSAILDSVVPVEANVLQEYPASIQSSLSKVFTTCAANPSCNQVYPDLEKVFWEVINELDANPITLTTSAYPIGTVTETVDGYYLLSVVMGLARNADLIDTIPQTIYRVHAKDYSTLTAAQYSLPYSLDGISPGLYISMVCREHILASTEENLHTTMEKLDVNDLIWRPFYGGFDDMFQTCTSWKLKGPDLSEKDAVVSDIPSLIIEGAYDPATPPVFGKQVAENLSNSFYFEFPNMGHVPTGSDSSGCAMQIAMDFIENPEVEPDRSCLNEIKEVEFLTPYTGEPALDFTKRSVYGVNLDIPTGWYKDGDFFIRYSSPFDVTQTGFVKVSSSTQEVMDYFSSSVYGYRGLDNAPTEVGAYEANGYIWRLYTSTSNGHPVDIGLTSIGSNTLFISLISHADEHTALYDTVFLHMMDSVR